MTTTMTVLQLKGRVLWVVEHRFVGYGGANVLVFLVGWVSEPTVRVDVRVAVIQNSCVMRMVKFTRCETLENANVLRFIYFH